MTEQDRKIMESVKSAEPIADALAKVPEASRDIALKIFLEIRFWTCYNDKKGTGRTRAA